MRRTRNIKGFTLVEVLFAITIGLLLLGAIFVAVQSGQRSSVAIEAKTTAQQDVRAVLELMSLEIGMASYYRYGGVGVTNPWPGSTNKGILEATPTALRIQMDIDPEDGAVVGNNEDLRYEYIPAEQRVTRRAGVAGGAQPFLGCADANGDGRCDDNTTLRTVRVINNTLPINNGNGVPAIFRYYDGSGAELYPDANPLVIPNIRRIDITLAVETETIDPNTGQRRRMIYSTSVIPRNHAINP